MKKNLILFTITYLGIAICETLINQVFLSGTYNSLTGLWRPTSELGNYAPIFFLIYLVFAICFNLLFQKSYQNGGLLEGAKLGFIIGGLVKFWYGYTNFIVLPIPQSLGFLWFFYGTLETIILGVLAAYYLDRSRNNN